MASLAARILASVENVTLVAVHVARTAARRYMLTRPVGAYGTLPLVGVADGDCRGMSFVHFAFLFALRFVTLGYRFGIDTGGGADKRVLILSTYIAPCTNGFNAWLRSATN